MDFDPHWQTFRLSTGRYLRAAEDILVLGLDTTTGTTSPEDQPAILVAHTGRTTFCYRPDPAPMTQDERDEIASRMIQRWESWRTNPPG